MSIMSKTATTEKLHYLFIGLIILVLLLGIFAIQARGNKIETAMPPAENINPENPEEAVNTLTVWSIINMTDWLFWPFILITAAGVMLIVYHVLKEHQEQVRSRMILQGKIGSTDLRALFRLIQGSNESRVSRLLQQMITTFNKTGNAEPIGDDVNQFLSSEREAFETFNRVTGFLSDTAGALGLLGTVWGIFQTFHGGKLDGPTILQGMSISLVTTLVGLIISLLLNMGATYVFTIFNGQLKLVGDKAEELRQALLYYEKKGVAHPTTKERNGKSRVSDPEYPPKRRRGIEETAEIPF